MKHNHRHLGAFDWVVLATNLIGHFGGDVSVCSLSFFILSHFSQQPSHQHNNKQRVENVS
jgi:hypothetical protein